MRDRPGDKQNGQNYTTSMFWTVTGLERMRPDIKDQQLVRQLRMLAANTEEKRSEFLIVNKRFQNSFDSWNRYVGENWFQFISLR